MKVARRSRGKKGQLALVEGRSGHVLALGQAEVKLGAAAKREERAARRRRLEASDLVDDDEERE